MPPAEKDGKQVELVDSSNQSWLIWNTTYSREDAALQGQVYNPIVGFNLVATQTTGGNIHMTLTTNLSARVLQQPGTPSQTREFCDSSSETAIP